MRLWSISPVYLDTKGLLALWREALLAKKVLEGKTKGYKNHPQLERFKNYTQPLVAINSYLYYVLVEAGRRGYNFDNSKINTSTIIFEKIPVTKGQIGYELFHLASKLKFRSPEYYRIFERLLENEGVKLNPVFYIVDGDIEKWEKLKNPCFFKKSSQNI